MDAIRWEAVTSYEYVARMPEEQVEVRVQTRPQAVEGSRARYSGSWFDVVISQCGNRVRKFRVQGLREAKDRAVEETRRFLSRQRMHAAVFHNLRVGAF